MKIKQAILKVLEDNIGSFTYKEVLKMIDEKNYVNWQSSKTPADTISAQLGHFIRQNDSRVKRVKGKRGFEYYLAKYENDLNLSEIVETEAQVKKHKSKNEPPRDCRRLNFLREYDNENTKLYPRNERASRPYAY